MAHELAVRVYYEDTDLGGVVYHANYLKFMERGRTEALRAAGLDQSRLRAETGLVFVVTRLSVAYRRPARFDDLLTVRTAAARIGGASLDVTQSVLRRAEALVDAHVRVACVDGLGRPARLPPAARAAFGG